MIGTTVSHYKILEQLGAGGMGVVYKAEDTQLKRTVALKFLPPTLTSDPEAQQRFVHEAQAASALDHPNICVIHEIGHTDGGQTFIVMACYEGASLKSTIENRELRIEKSIDIAIQIAEGLARAHEAGIVHRDIKPANIFITTHSEVKILDFGLAKLTGQTILTKAGSTLGTAAYMSPDQAKGEPVDHRTDIWSLGVILYEMLTGRPPFESNYEQALIYEILNQDPPPVRALRPEVSEVLEQCVLKALAKKPEERYQTAEDFLADLKAARAPEQTAVTIAATEATERKKKKNRVRIFIAAGAGLLLLAVLFVVVLPLFQDQALASNPRAIAFISFENRTGDESLAYLRNVLPEVLGTTLEESKYIRVIQSDRIRELMKDVGKDTVEFIDKETGLLLCRRAKIDVLCVGNYTKAGPIFLTELALIDVNTGNQLGSPVKARGREVESFLKEDGIVDDLARQISKGMGVSPMGTGSTVKPIAEVSSGSIQAQRYYQRGKQEITKFNTTDARRLLEMAVKEDSTFAIAWFWLGAACGYLGDSPAREFAMSHAVKNASRATEKERFWIAGVDSSLRASLLKSKGYKDTGRDNLSWLKVRTEIFPLDSDFRRDYGIMLGSYLGRTAEAIPEYEKAIQLDPAVGRTWNELGYCYVFEGQYDKGMQALERSAELDPGEPNPLQSMADCFLIQGKFDEGITKCEAALQVKPDSYQGLTLAKLYFMKEDYIEAVRWTARASELAPTPLLRDDCRWWRAWFLVWCGRLKEAGEVLHASEQKIMSEYRKNNITESDMVQVFGGISWLKGWCAYEQGEWKKARLNFSDLPARGIWPSLSQFCLGLLDLQQGMTDSIEMRQRRIRDILLARVEREPARSELELETDRYMRNALQGAYLLAADHPEKIQPNWTRRRSNRIQNLDSLAAANWPLFVPRISEPWDMQWIPTPFDILPRAYIRRGMIDSAIASYELALRKPPHALGPIIPRYYYRVARLYEQKGMKDKAIENYTLFLKVWGKADPVYKEPGDARKRLARIKSTI